MFKQSPGLVVGCTNRKRYPPELALTASSLELGPQTHLQAQWRKRLSRHHPRVRAEDLYCGRAFTEAVAAAGKFAGPLWIVSAGLGLVGSSDAVPSYDLTITPTADESIQRRLLSDGFSQDAWWRTVNRGSRTPAPLSTLIHGELKHRPLMVLAISTQYLHLVAADLRTLSSDTLGRIRVLTRWRLPPALGHLAPASIVYGDKLDGPDSPLPGTIGDFAPRTARHFAEQIWSHAPGADARGHQRLVNRNLRRLGRPAKPARTRKSDSEILRLIHTFWRRVDGRSGRMLRFLRDEQMVACEQGRFRRLFHLAASQRIAQ